ncbi:MAG TPA: hypothetical protein VMB34_13810 [Acetobacteraceae bacterium]|nr:hypothetical protein [Acetobacteraceae bacterium]
MPRGRKPQGDHALSNAERQARHRARLRVQQPPARCGSPPPPPELPTKSRRRSRPQRWREAVVELLALQGDYAAWLAALPASLQDSPTAQALQAVIDLDLDALAAIEPPRGYGRD